MPRTTAMKVEYMSTDLLFFHKTSDSDHSLIRGIPVVNQSVKEHNQLITSW